MKRHSGILDSIVGAVGGTPLVALDRLAGKLPGRVALKLEYFSPGGSIKDRPALACLEAAEKAGLLRKGMHVVELTSGNMGAGLAWACAVKGYKFTAVMSAGNTPERRQMIRAFGAKVALVPQAKGGAPGQVSHEDMEAVEAKTQELVRKLKAFRPDQFNNPAAAAAHRDSTGPEIWAQTGGALTHFVSFAGSSGTLIGTATFLKSKNPRIQTFVVEPASTRFLAGKKIKSTRHVIQGGGYATLPGIYNSAVVDGALAVTDAEAVKTTRLLASKEGIMCGFSSGANVAAALKLARQAKRGSLIVTVACDTGLKYLSTSLYPV
jgi:cysteine synthase A